MLHAGRLGLFFNSIKGKILTLFLVAFLVACGLTLLNVWTLATVRERLTLSERYDDLLNDILEARRFEKNLVIYGDDASRHEGAAYLDKADAALSTLAPDIARVSGPNDLEEFRTTLAQYRSEFSAIGAAKATERDIARGAGKRLVDMAEALMATKRERIHRTISHLSLLPFAYLGVFLVFMGFLVHVIAKSLLRPLGMIGQITARVAKGDFRPVDSGGHHHIEEVAGLLDALNRMALELMANQEHLLQARKIAALGTLTAGIAHEINNPINNVMISAESLLETHGDMLDDEGREVLSDILAQAERAGDIVRNLLNFARTEKAGFSALSPDAVVQSSLALLKNQLHVSGLGMEVDVPAGLPPVLGNLRHLQQVFLNLLQNAIAATPPGGQVSVSGREEEGFVRLTVRDTGAGIPRDNLDHIFEPFFTTKEVGKGTGLGLAVSYSIIKRHGGRIEVESAPGQGAAFHVLLPKAPASPEGAEEVSRG
jgi:signal transduction histidine kinase